MAEVTLADINQTLISVDENTQTTSRGIDGFLRYLEEKRRDDLEAERERKARKVEISKDKSDSTGKTGGGFKFPSLGLGKALSGLGSILTVGGALGLAKALGSRLIKRGLLAALGVGLADTIANKLVTGNDQASAELRTTLSNTISGAAIGGAIFGKKGGLIGAIAGALLSNPKTKEAFKDLGTNLENMAKDVFGDVDVKGTVGNAVKTFSGLVGDGVNAANRLLTGQSENVAKDIAGSLATIGGLALLVSPKSTISGGKKTLTGLLKAFSKAGPIGKSVAAILGLLGLTYITPDGGLDDTTSKLSPFGPGNDNTPASKDYGTDKTVLNTSLATVGAASAGKIVADTSLENLRNRNLKGSMAGKFDMQGGLTAKDIRKYARLQKVLKFIGGAGFFGLGLAFELPEMRAILADDSLSDREKAKRMAPILGRMIGGTGFAAIGSRIGSAIGPKGMIIGGLLGGAAGYFGGDYAGELLAQWLLGGDPKLPPAQAKLLREAMTNKIVGFANKQGSDRFDVSNIQNLDVSTLGLQRPLKTSDSLVNNLQAINTKVAGEMGYNDRGNLKTFIDASVKDNSVKSSSAAIYGDGSTVNMQDQFSGGRVAAGT